MFGSVSNGYHAPYPPTQTAERDGKLNIASQVPDRLTSASLSREFGHHMKVLDDDFVVVWLLISLIDELIKFYDLKSDQIFGIENIQENNKIVGEIASEIKRIRDDSNFDDSQLVKLVEKFSVSVGFSLKTLRNFTHISGCSDLCNLYEKLNFYSEKQRLNILNIRSQSTPIQPPFESISKPFYSHPALSSPFQEATEELRSNRQFVIAAVRKNGLSLEHVNDDFLKDPEIVFEAASQNVLALQYAGQELRNNWEFMFKIVTHYFQSKFSNSSSLKYLWDLLSDLQFTLEVLMPIAFTECKNNRELLLRNVMCQGRLLMLADEKLKSDRELVLAAVSQDGLALEFADENLRNNKDVAEVAMKQNWKAIEFAGQQLQDDEQFMLASIKQHWEAIKFASPKLRDDEQFLHDALKYNWKAIQFASPRLKDDKKFMSAVIKLDPKERLWGNWQAIEFAGEKLKDDEEFALEAFREWGGAFQYFSERLRTNQEFCLKAALRYEDPIVTEELKVDSDRNQSIARYQEEVDNKIKNTLSELAEVVREIQLLDFDQDAILVSPSKREEEVQTKETETYHRLNDLKISLSTRLFELQTEARDLMRLKNKKF